LLSPSVILAYILLILKQHNQNILNPGITRRPAQIKKQKTDERKNKGESKIVKVKPESNEL